MLAWCCTRLGINEAVLASPRLPQSTMVAMHTNYMEGADESVTLEDSVLADEPPSVPTSEDEGSMKNGLNEAGASRANVAEAADEGEAKGRDHTLTNSVMDSENMNEVIPDGESTGLAASTQEDGIVSMPIPNEAVAVNAEEGEITRNEGDPRNQNGGESSGDDDDTLLGDNDTTAGEDAKNNIKENADNAHRESDDESDSNESEDEAEGNSDEEVEWLLKIEDPDVYKKAMIPQHFCLKIKSPAALEERHLRQALDLLLSDMKWLRLSTKQRGNDFWLCYSPKRTMQIRVCDGENLGYVMEEPQRSHYYQRNSFIFTISVLSDTQANRCYGSKRRRSKNGDTTKDDGQVLAQEYSYLFLLAGPPPLMNEASSRLISETFLKHLSEILDKESQKQDDSPNTSVINEIHSDLRSGTNNSSCIGDPTIEIHTNTSCGPEASASAENGAEASSEIENIPENSKADENIHKESKSDESGLEESKCCQESSPKCTASGPEIHGSPDCGSEGSALNGGAASPASTINIDDPSISGCGSEILIVGETGSQVSTGEKCDSTVNVNEINNCDAKDNIGIPTDNESCSGTVNNDACSVKDSIKESVVNELREIQIFLSHFQKTMNNSELRFGRENGEDNDDDDIYGGVRKTLSLYENKSFMNVCKSNRVSYFNAFVACVNAAAVKLLVDAGLEIDKEIIISFKVNVGFPWPRQEWWTDQPDDSADGDDVDDDDDSDQDRSIVRVSTVPKAFLCSFWKTAQAINRKQWEEAEKQRPEIPRKIRPLTEEEVADQSEGPCHPDLHLSVPNITETFSGDIQSHGFRVTNVRKLTFLHQFLMTFNISLYTDSESGNLGFYLNHDTVFNSKSIKIRFAELILAVLKRSLHL